MYGPPPFKFPLGFDPNDPYGLRKRSPQSTVGPTDPRNMVQQDAEPDSDFIRMLKSLGKNADEFMSGPMVSGTIPGVAYQAGKMFVAPIAKDLVSAGKIALEPTGLVDKAPPGSPSRGERFTDVALPLALAFYPIGGASKVEVKVAEEALEKGTILRTNEAERVIGRDAAGNELTNRGRSIRASAPPITPQDVPTRDIRPPIRPVAGRTAVGSTVRVMKTVKDFGFEDLVRRETAMRGEPTAINVEHAARTVLDSYDDLVRSGVTPESAKRTLLMQHEAEQSVATPNPMSLEGTLRQEHGVFPHEGAGLPGPDNNKTRVIADQLIKEDAISRTKALKGAGQNVEMQRQPDGTWSVLKKGDPQPSTAVAKNPAQLVQEKMDAHDAAYQKFMAEEYKPAEDALRTDSPDFDYNNYEILRRRKDDFLNDADKLTQEMHAAKWEMERDPKAIGPKGGPIGDGEFQSRLLTTLEYRHHDVKALTPEEWYTRLSNDKNVPKAELDAIFDSRQTPESNAKLAEMQKRYDELVEWRSDPEHQPPNGPSYGRSPEDEVMWSAWHEKKNELDALSDEMRDLQRSKKDWGDYLDKNGKLTREEMQRLVTDESPVASLERSVQITEEGATREMDHDDIRNEMDNIMEHRSQEIKEELQTKVTDSQNERAEALKDAQGMLEDIIGPEAAAKWMDALISDHSLDDNLMSADNSTLDNLREGWDEDLWTHIDALKPDDPEPVKLDDPLQVPMFDQLRPAPSKLELRYQELLQERERLHERHHNAGQGDNPPLYGQDYNNVMSRISSVERDILDHEHWLSQQKPIGERKFMPRQWEEFRKIMERAENADKEGAQAALDHDTFDPEEHFTGRERDRIEREAIENLEETGEYGSSGDRETEFHDYQRVDENAPYREVLIHQHGAGISGGHFNKSKDLVAHARGEIHGDTYLMIEAQSDFAQRLRGAAPSHVPFADTERWAQLSTGGSLIQAASENRRYFAWVTPENRVETAHLAEEAANITYGHAVPKAVQRIFKWLDMPFKPTKFLGDEAMRVEITPEMRKRILKAGIPALGLVGAAGIEAKKRD